MSQSWQFKARTMNVLLGLLVLSSVLVQCDASVKQHGEYVRKDVSQPQYKVVFGANATGGFMRTFVRNLLNKIYHRPFPQDIFLKIIRMNASNDEAYSEDIHDQLLTYIWGFSRSALIFTLYIVAMPVLGIIVVCCRSCGNLGGKMYQQQDSLIHCERITIFCCLIIISLIIFAGTMNMLKSNLSFKEGIELAPDQVSNMLTNIQLYVHALPEQEAHVQNQSEETINQVTKNFQEIGSLLGVNIQRRLWEHLGPVANRLNLLHKDIEDLSKSLLQLDLLIKGIQSSLDIVQQHVQSIRIRITATLSRPECIGCQLLQSDVDSLNLDLNNKIIIPMMKEFWDEVEKVKSINLKLRAEEVNDYLNNIPPSIGNNNKDLTEIFRKLPPPVLTPVIFRAISEIRTLLDEFQAELNLVKPYVVVVYGLFKEFWWKCGFGLCSIVLGILMCNLLGMVLGFVGLKPKADPTMRSKTSDCGGTFFLMSTGLSFSLSWLMMAVAVALFFIGGTFYTVLCRPVRNGQILKAMDSTDFITKLRKSPGGRSNITAADIYSDCKQNRSLWTTIKLQNDVDIDELLNVSRQMIHMPIHHLFLSSRIVLSKPDILSSQARDQLREFSAKAEGFNNTVNVDQTDYLFDLDLNTAMAAFEFAAARTEGLVRQEFETEATVLKILQGEVDHVIKPKLKSINSIVDLLRSLATKISRSVDELLRNVEEVQNTFKTVSDSIIRTESRAFLDTQVKLVLEYKDWAKKMVTEHLGRCQPVAGMLDYVDNVFCGHLVEPLNIFWLSLFWCLILFIPNIFFSLTLSKYYKIMEYSDEYDDPFVMNNIIMYPDGNTLKIHESYYFGEL